MGVKANLNPDRAEIMNVAAELIRFRWLTSDITDDEHVMIQHFAMRLKAVADRMKA